MPFEFVPLPISGVVLIRPKVFKDDRGFFLETYERKAFEAGGVRGEFVQDNQSHSNNRGVLRGLHFQREPHAQAKLVRCVQGRIFDVAVDLRRGSPSYGKHVATELSGERLEILYVPRGFAHGYLTLTQDCEVHYKVDAPYTPAAEGGLIWNDPAVAIPWPAKDPALNDRDRRWPRLSGLA